MNDFKIIFTPDEITRFFREHGLQVTENRIEKHSGGESWNAWEWQVQNPHTGTYENIETAFRRAIEHRYNSLLLAGYNKVDLLNTFKKNNDGQSK